MNLKFRCGIKMALAAALILTSALASAFTPETGWWWNPSEPGRGYNIEIQDNFAFVSFYVYSDTGEAVWYVAGGELTGNSLLVSELDAFEDGQCLGCEHQEPFFLPGFAGSLELEFHTETTATMTIGEGASAVVIPIERFLYAPIFGETFGRVFGEWKSIVDVSTALDFPYLGDVTILNANDDCGGIACAVGCRPDNSQAGACSVNALTNHDAASSYDPQTDTFMILVHDTPDTFQLYFDVEVQADSFIGEATYYPVGGSPNFDSSFPVEAFRSASASFVQTGIGPSRVKALNAADAAGDAGITSRHPELIQWIGPAGANDSAKNQESDRNERLQQMVSALEARLILR